MTIATLPLEYRVDVYAANGISELLCRHAKRFSKSLDLFRFEHDHILSPDNVFCPDKMSISAYSCCR